MAVSADNIPGKCVVAAVQHCAGTDVDANMTVLCRLSRKAAEQGARVIAWPEAFAYLGPHRGKQPILEPLPGGGPILAQCQALAAELQCELLLGGFHEAVAQDASRCYNTSVYLNADGNIAGLYRKIHLFDVNIPDGPQLQESKQTAAGDRAVCVPTRFGTLGMTVCYDVRFPLLYQQLVDQGAIAMSVPSAFTATTGALHWHALLRARAIETQSFVIAPAQHGRHSKHRQSYGHSLIIDPSGQVLAELDQGDGFICAELDPAAVSRIRTEIPSLANRQPFS